MPYTGRRDPLGQQIKITKTSPIRSRLAKPVIFLVHRNAANIEIIKLEKFTLNGMNKNAESRLAAK
jgi:hypothetical protein